MSAKKMGTTQKKRIFWAKNFAALMIITIAVLISPSDVIVVSSEIVTGSVIAVPGDLPTIQEGIDAATNGDIVLIAPGTYHENLILDGKTIILASWFHTTGQNEYIDQTIIDGRGDTVIEITNVGDATKLVGLTIQNGDDGISSNSKIHIFNNKFIGNRDGVDYEGGGGLCSNNIFVENRDDGIDLDYSTEVSITNNVIQSNYDDGIEIRLHRYSGRLLNVIISENIILQNQEDGIQLIDYPDVSNRNFLFEHNVFSGNTMAAIGFMADGNTIEDLNGAPIPERVKIVNNTFIGENYGVVGGNNVIALNNIFKDIQYYALRRVSGNSIASYNLFWNNGIDFEETNIDLPHTLFADPLLDPDYFLTGDSAAIDTGTPIFTWQGKNVLNMPKTSYIGSAPDLGAFETGWKFAVVGDLQARDRTKHFSDEVVQGIINKMLNNEVTIISPGDLVNSPDEHNWQLWAEILAPLNINGSKTNLPEYIGAVGNHDTGTLGRGGLEGWDTRWVRHLPAQLSLSAYPSISAHPQGFYGSVKYENAIFIWADSVTPTSEQDIFLEDTLQLADADSEVTWKFVFFHYPPVPCGSKGNWRTGQEWNDDYFVPYGVDVIFLGHAHYYERTCPFVSAVEKTCDENNRGDAIGDSAGVVHIITGGGGGNLYSTDDCSWLEQKAEAHHFVEIEISGNRFHLKVWEIDNGGGETPTLIDNFSISKPTLCRDNDDDGYGNPASQSCVFPDLDCDDSDAAINPAATEICDSIDNNCDTFIDEYVDLDGIRYSICNDECETNPVDKFWYEDVDGDGYSSGNTRIQCARPWGFRAESDLLALSGDCDDTDAAIHPGAMEFCDGIDNDCEVKTEDGSGESWYGFGCDGPDRDLCEEGIYECINISQSCSDVGEDTLEICGDGTDNDCDGIVDEPNFPQLFVMKFTPVADASVDRNVSARNYGARSVLEVDGAPVKITYLRFDITGLNGTVESVRLKLNVVDSSPVGGTIHAISDTNWDEKTITYNSRPIVDGPILDALGAVKSGNVVEFDVTRAIIGEGTYSFAIISDDSNGADYSSRENTANPPEMIITLQREFPYYCDDDFDGYIDMTIDGNAMWDGCLPTGCQVGAGNDCNDSEAAVKPPASEICDGIDNNCNDFIDDSDPEIIGRDAWYADTDSDGYGDPNISMLACNQPAGYVSDNSDCDSTSGTINPGSTEICDNIDNNCNNLTDDSDPEIIGQGAWYADADSDGYGDPNISMLACNQPAGYVSDNSDCDSTSGTINPGSTEICDNIDNNCNNLTDDSDPEIIGQGAWYADADSDGYGDPNISMLACNQPAGYVSDNSDCNDKNFHAYPDQTWYEDADGDGYSSGAMIIQCDRPVVYKAEMELTALSGDCDDNDSAIHPGAIEFCDTIDNDCNPETDNGHGESWYGVRCDGADTDQCKEGIFECANSRQVCTDFSGDTQEMCSDGIDNDCDGIVDELNFLQPLIIPQPLVKTIHPVADASVIRKKALANYGSSPVLEVDGAPVKITYLRFDITGLNGTVESVRLKLNVVDSSPVGGTIHAISDTNWDEKTITYNSRPIVDGPILDALGAVKSGNVVEFDVTRAIIGEGTYSFAIISDDSNGADYSSRENTANPPEMIITLQREFPYYCDDDSDGYTDSISDGTTTWDGCLPAGCQAKSGSDCDDGNSGINPAAYEICDGVDNDCNADTTDGDGETAQLNSYQEGACLNSVQSCIDGAWVDDYSGATNYEVVETSCSDFIDNDCDRLVDGDDPSCLTPIVINVAVAAGSDDAEERASGTMYLTSSDLELVHDFYNNAGNQKVGMRFNGITIPPGATITNAYIQFQVDETSSGMTHLMIQGEASGNAPTFTTAAWNISNRPLTDANVPWTPPPWPAVNVQNVEQQTPDISSIIQEIVSLQGGWVDGNSLVIIITGTGERVAESFNGVPAAAPLLHVEYVP